MPYKNLIKFRIKSLSIKVLLTLLAFLFLFRHINLASIFSLLVKIDLSFVFYAFVIALGTVFVGAYKWSKLLPECKFYALFDVSIASYFFSLILPGQISQEFLKGFYLSKSFKASKNKIAASIFVDKLLAIFSLFLLSTCGLIFSSSSTQALFLNLNLLTTFFLFSTIFLFSRNFFHLYIINFLKKPFFNSKIFFINPIQFMNCIFLYFKDMRVLRLNLLLNVFFQILAATFFYVLSLSFSFNINILDWFWINAFLTMALFIPFTIAGFGIREGALIGLLSFFGYTANDATAFSLAFFLLQVVLAIIGSIFYFKRL
jgi:uncharacterized protein (TIRG00374 family)